MDGTPRLTRLVRPSGRFSTLAIVGWSKVETRRLRWDIARLAGYREGEKNDGTYEGKILDRQLLRESPVLSMGGLEGCPILINDF